PVGMLRRRQGLGHSLGIMPIDAAGCPAGSRKAAQLVVGCGKRQITIISTGSEVEIALKARDLLAAEGVRAAVVSMPSWELFDRQPEAYRAEVLGVAGHRVAVEALSPFGWERYVGVSDAIIGMPGFGASAPADKLYPHFGITAEAVAAKARKFAVK
ncbi:MAG: hypothetical protein HQL43_13700, partial [Alphaproteobacteria bacterium]|nr:hypothetical protein [Alphaproteobacteria bacterium]